jgi:hypothetical protein
MNVPVGENKVDTLGLDFQVSNSVSTLYWRGMNSKHILGVELQWICPSTYWAQFPQNVINFGVQEPINEYTVLQKSTNW